MKGFLMNNFEWHYFGKLEKVSNDEDYLYITNAEGRILKMSLKKYKENALSVKEKSQSLIGLKVIVRTSKNTSNWSSSEWFSDIAEESK